MGNLQAPPVYSDPSPIAAPAPIVAPTVGAPSLPAPPGVVPVVAAAEAPVAAPLITTMRPAGVPTVATPIGTCAPPGVRYLRLTPNGVMAPIGSEIVLKAGVADCDGSLLVNRQVEWGIAGPGQFSELGTRYQIGLITWPWQSPRRIAANYATSTTALTGSTLYSGTPDPNDDVPIFRGEAWVTVTSACEGTSLVTAYAPSLENYNRVTVPVYWVDAQFLFPASATVEPGRPHVLTTTVLRRSDNAPLVGWTVRYNVARGAALGYEGGNSVEAKTDAAGRASVEVSPVDPGGGTANVDVSIYRPAVGGPGGTPPLGLARGNATITWGGGMVVTPSAAPPVISTPVPPTLDPYTPSAPPPPMNPYSPGAPSLPPGNTPPLGPPPSTQPSTVSPPPATSAPPASQPAPALARLDVEVRSTTPSEVSVGDFASFDVIVTNRGDATTRGAALRVAIPAGLRHAKQEPGATEIEYKVVDEIAPNQSKTIPLTFEVIAEGQQCATVTVVAEGVAPVSKRGCVTGIKPAFASFNLEGPVSRTVGAKAEFKIIIKNGSTAARNVAVVLRFDPAFEPILGSDPNYQQLADGSILLKVGDIVANEQRTFPPPALEALCKAAKDNACVQADLTVGGAFVLSDQHCVSILPGLPAGEGNFNP
jgi:hypothetical protein